MPFSASTPLIDAVKAGDRDAVRRQLEQGDNLGARDVFRKSALMYAAERGDEAITTTLLNHGAAVDEPQYPPDGGRPLEFAIAGSHAAIVKLLLHRGAKATGNALNYAAVRGDLASVNLLLDHGAAITKLPNGSMPLLSLCIFGPEHARPLPLDAQARTVERLIAAGADVNMQDPQRNTPLLSAVRIGNDPVVELLLKSGADPNALDGAALAGSRNEAMARRLLQVGIEESIRRRVFWGWLKGGRRDLARLIAETLPEAEHALCSSGLALLNAVRRADRDAVRRLTDESANQTMLAQFGGLALLDAVGLWPTEKRPAMVGQLLQTGVGNAPDGLSGALIHAVAARNLPLVRQLLAARNRSNLSAESLDAALRYAVGAADYWNDRVGPATCFEPAVDEMASVLLAAGAHANGRDGDGKTPLLYAIWRYPHNLQRLLDAGAEVNLAANEGCTPLMAADDRVAAILLSAGANPQARLRDGQTALHVCLSAPKAKLLIQHGADPEARDAMERTPLIAQAFAGRADVVEFLAGLTKNIDAKDRDGTTALLAAAMAGHEGIAGFLLGRGASLQACNRHGRTVLNGACRNGKLGLAKGAIEGGAPLDARDEEGATALIQAAGFGYDELVRLLLARGADASLRDNLGRTAYERALLFGRNRTAKIFEELP